MKLRHIKGFDLLSLEKQVEAFKFPCTVYAINNVGGEWFVHFFIDRKNVTENLEINMVEAEKTKEIKKL
jgi:hypothetical protein